MGNPGGYSKKLFLGQLFSSFATSRGRQVKRKSVEKVQIFPKKQSVRCLSIPGGLQERTRGKKGKKNIEKRRYSVAGAQVLHAEIQKKGGKRTAVKGGGVRAPSVGAMGMKRSPCRPNPPKT